MTIHISQKCFSSTLQTENIKGNQENAAPEMERRMDLEIEQGR